MALNDRIEELTRVEITDLSVLVADPDPDRHEGLIAALVAEGFLVHTAVDMPEVLEHLQTDTHAALVASDLPPGGGLELIARARQVSPATSFVLMAGDVSMTNAVDALRTGAIDYLESPITDVPRAIERIHAVLERSVAVHKNRVLAQRLSEACVRLLSAQGELQTVKNERAQGLTAGLIERLSHAHVLLKRMELELQGVLMGLQPAGSSELIPARAAATDAIAGVIELREMVDSIWTSS